MRPGVLEGPKPESYVKFGSSQTYSFSAQYPELVYRIKVDSYTDISKAHYKNDFLSICCLLGGLSVLLYFPLAAMSGYLARWLFVAELIPELYQLRQGKEAFFKRHNISPSQDRYTDVKTQESTLNKYLRTGKLDPGDIKRVLFDKLVSTKPFRVSFVQCLKYVFKPILTLVKRVVVKVENKNNPFDRAYRQYLREIDILVLLKKVREGSSFRRLTMSSEQMALLKFSGLYVVNSEEDDSSSGAADVADRDIFESLNRYLQHEKLLI